MKWIFFLVCLAFISFTGFISSLFMGKSLLRDLFFSDLFSTFVFFICLTFISFIGFVSPMFIYKNSFSDLKKGSFSDRFNTLAVVSLFLGAFLSGLLLEVMYYNKVFYILPSFFFFLLTLLIVYFLSKKYYNMGNAYHEKCDYDKAIEYYERALRIDPNYTDARKALEEMNVMLHRHYR